MSAANTYFVIIAWVNLLVPFGYWFLWAWFVLDPVNNVLPLVTAFTELLEAVVDFLADLGEGDLDGDGDEDADDATLLTESTELIQEVIEDFIALIDSTLGILSWPLIAACGLASFLSFSPYWVINYYGGTAVT